MQQHALDGKIVMGVNHEMRDFQNDRAKVLDLVIARPGPNPAPNTQTFRGLAQHYGVILTSGEQALLQKLPDVEVAPVGAVLMALEAKATMTAHIKALPRLHDELNSSHLAIHGASNQALAVAYVQINNSNRFLSSVTNSKAMSKGHPPEYNEHTQPKDTQRVLDKVAQIPRRTGKSGNGFDAIGVTVLDFVNDGGPVDLVTSPPAPPAGSNYHYEGMIVRMANEYDATFAHI
jgi:hypothetical protein